MYYNTTIRNVALITAVSFAALGYSRFYRGKSKLYVSGMIFVSLLLLTCSAIINYLLLSDIEKYKDLSKYKQINKWRTINIIFMLIHFITIIFAMYTLFRILHGKTFEAS